MLNYSKTYFTKPCQFCRHVLDNNNLRDMRCSLPHSCIIHEEYPWEKFVNPVDPHFMDNPNWEKKAATIAAEGCPDYEE